MSAWFRIEGFVIEHLWKSIIISFFAGWAVAGYLYH